MGRQVPNEGPTNQQLERTRAKGAELADFSSHHAPHGTETREHTTA
jgi:hypothetical protein